MLLLAVALPDLPDLALRVANPGLLVLPTTAPDVGTLAYIPPRADGLDRHFADPGRVTFLAPHSLAD